MRIVLSNDDGILADGLAALHAAVADMGRVTVVAPEVAQNAVGHSITLKVPMAVRSVRVERGGFDGISVAGRPADCVSLAIRKLVDGPPDLVLAGINDGANAGVNVFYSGTVAAAAEAAFLGVPAFAFSAAREGEEPDYERCGRLARWVLDRFLADGLAAGDLINVNFPVTRSGFPLGVRVVPQSTAEVKEVYHRSEGADGGPYYRLADQYSFAHQADTDVEALAEGYITITPLHVDMTNHDRLVGLSRRSWPSPPP